MLYKVTYYAEGIQEENPVWAVIEADDSGEAERVARNVLVEEYDGATFTWLETDEYWENPDDYLISIEPGVWL